MAIRCYTIGSRLAGALLTLAIASPAALAQPGEGVVFVGDGDPSQAVAGPRLPTLSRPVRGGDPRYLPQAVVQEHSRPAPSAGPATRAAFADAVSQQIRQRQSSESQERKSLFGRLFAGNQKSDSGQQPEAQPKTQPVMVSDAPTPTAAAPSRGGIELTGYYDAQRGRQRIESPRGTQRVGLLDFGNRKAPTKSPGRATTARSRSATPSPRTTAAPAAPKLAERKPSAPENPWASRHRLLEEKGAGVVFVGDEPTKTAAPAKRAPAPVVVTSPPRLLPKPPAASQPVPNQRKTAARATNRRRRATRAIDSAPAPVAKPVMVENPVAKQPLPKPTKPAAKAVAEALDNPADKPAAPTGPTPRAVALLAEANQQANAAATENDYTLVVQRCRHVLAIDDHPQVVDYSRKLAAWALNKRGETRANAGRDSEATTDFFDALTMNKDCWRATHNLGVFFAQTGRFAEAFDAFNDTVDTNPQFAKAYSNRASLYVQAGDFDAALADYGRAIAADPDLAIAHRGRGRVCHMLGRMEEAMRHFDAAVLLMPGDASTANCRADLLVDMGRYAAATMAYQQAIQLDDRLAASYRNLAWLQATCPDEGFRNGEAALENAQLAIQLEGAEDDIGLDTLAAAQAAVGDFEAAATTLQRAIEIAPPNDQPIYQERLTMYEAGTPFYSAPVETVQQVDYQRITR